MRAVRAQAVEQLLQTFNRLGRQVEPGKQSHGCFYCSGGSGKMARSGWDFGAAGDRGLDQAAGDIEVSMFVSIGHQHGNDFVGVAPVNAEIRIEREDFSRACGSPRGEPDRHPPRTWAGCDSGA